MARGGRVPAASAPARAKKAAPVKRGRREEEAETVATDDVDDFMDARQRGAAATRAPKRGSVRDESDDDDEEDLYDDDNVESVFDVPSSDEDSDEEESEQEEIGDNGKWGQRRSAFYDGDEIASDDEEAAEMMHKEVKRLQARKYADMDASDFIDDSLGAAVRKGTKAAKGGKAAKSAPSAAATQVEVIEKDFAEMNDGELLKLIKRQSPELLSLLDDFKVKISDIRDNLSPLINQLKAGELPTSRGISFLDVKYQLLLSYCMNLAFYFYLKASGRQVTDHPVVAQLVELRAFIEKLRPLESKFKYQIDKLVKAASMDGSAAKSADAAARAAQDPLRFRPNLGASADDEDDSAAKEVFKPTRMAPVVFDEESAGVKKQRRAERLLNDKSRKGRLLRELQEEFSDRPERHTEVREDDPDLQREQERTRYEEENFVRLTVSKTDRKRERRATEFRTDLDDLDDFGDFSAVMGAASGDAADRSATSELDELRRRPRKDAAKTARAASLVEEPTGEDDEDALAYYNNVRDAKKRRRDEREEEAGERRVRRVREEEEAQAEEEYDDGKRGASADMLKNRGLTPKRNKTIKNPRVKRRVKYAEAKIKLKSAGIKQAEAPTSSYAGESTGIKSKLSRSVRFK